MIRIENYFIVVLVGDLVARWGREMKPPEWGSARYNPIATSAKGEW